jgi:biopolymer transport protein ExbD
MSMGSFNSSGAQAPMAEINTTPLVDVMLVLLIIFIITAPLLTHSVKVDLPRASSAPVEQKPNALRVDIDADGHLSVDGQPMPFAWLEARLREAVERDAQIELHLMADRASRYEIVAEVMSAARRAGVGKIGFVTQPGTDAPGHSPSAPPVIADNDTAGRAAGVGKPLSHTESRRVAKGRVKAADLGLPWKFRVRLTRSSIPFSSVDLSEPSSHG